MSYLMKGLFIALLLVLILTLLGCASYPEKKIMVNVLVDEREDAKEYCSKLLGKRVLACTMFEGNNCKIVIDTISANENDMILGHEFRHCMEGPYHVEWKEIDPLKWMGPNYNPYGK